MGCCCGGNKNNVSKSQNPQKGGNKEVINEDQVVLEGNQQPKPQEVQAVEQPPVQPQPPPPVQPPPPSHEETLFREQLKKDKTWRTRLAQVSLAQSQTASFQQTTRSYQEVSGDILGPKVVVDTDVEVCKDEHHFGEHMIETQEAIKFKSIEYKGLANKITHQSQITNKLFIVKTISGVHQAAAKNYVNAILKEQQARKQDPMLKGIVAYQINTIMDSFVALHLVEIQETYNLYTFSYLEKLSLSHRKHVGVQIVEIFQKHRSLVNLKFIKPQNILIGQHSGGDYYVKLSDWQQQLSEFDKLVPPSQQQANQPLGYGPKREHWESSDPVVFLKNVMLLLFFQLDLSYNINKASIYESVRSLDGRQALEKVFKESKESLPEKFDLNFYKSAGLNNYIGQKIKVHYQRDANGLQKIWQFLSAKPIQDLQTVLQAD